MRDGVGLGVLAAMVVVVAGCAKERPAASVMIGPAADEAVGAADPFALAPPAATASANTAAPATAPNTATTAMGQALPTDGTGGEVAAEDAVPLRSAAIRPTPPIPAMLRGCWEHDPRDRIGHDIADPSERLMVGPDRIDIVAPWMSPTPVVVRPDYITRLTDRVVAGAFTYPGKGTTITYATEIGIGIRYGAENQLIVGEGRRSRAFLRCTR